MYYTSPSNTEQQSIYAVVAWKQSSYSFSSSNWKLTYNGDSVSLYPSIGNWNFECRSHYWITDNNIRWAGTWSDDVINQVKKRDKQDREEYIRKKNANKSKKSGR